MVLPKMAALALCLGTISDAKDTGPFAVSHRPPLVDGKPVEVTIGFYAMDFARVTSREESFDLTGYLELSWHDPSLAVPPDGDAINATRAVDASRIWIPRIFFDNALEQPRYHNEPVVEADEHGNITSWSILSGKFSTSMDLHTFPFDAQKLTVRIGSFANDTVQRYRIAEELVIVGNEAFVTDWTLGKASASLDRVQYVPGQEAYSRFTYEVDAKRRSTFYIWRVMLPLTLLALVAWAAFWFEPVGLQPQISTCMAALIALVAFNFVVDFSLGKLAYLTLIDRHALIGFAFVTAAVIAVTIIHLAVTRGQLLLARRIQGVFRWAFLLAYLVAVLVNMRSLIM